MPEDTTENRSKHLEQAITTLDRLYEEADRKKHKDHLLRAMRLCELELGQLREDKEDE